MAAELHRANLIVKKSSIHGYGVFADEDIAKGGVIEECYAIPLSASNHVGNYVFSANDLTVLTLGYGSIYNHSFSHNAAFEFDQEKSAMVFTAVCDIKKDEEIFIYYGKDWFSDRRATVRKPSFFYRLKWLFNRNLILIKGCFVASLIYFVIYICEAYFAIP